MSSEDNTIIIDLLEQILHTLQAMKQQEYDYWEAWKKAKEKENAQ